jgi:signal recognition particle GTPase
MKIELLSALKNGYLDTENIEALNKFVADREPARVLSKAEIKELFEQLEREF